MIYEPVQSPVGFETASYNNQIAYDRTAYTPLPLEVPGFSFLMIWGIFLKKFIPVYRYMRDRGVIIGSTIQTGGFV
jgi:hypothetical protein